MASYTSVPTSPSEEETFGLLEEQGKKIITKASPKSTERLFYWACLTTLCTTVLTLAVLVVTVMGSTFSQSEEASSGQQFLQRPSTYINLEKVLASSPNLSFPPILNFPDAVYQIVKTDFRRRMTEDHRSYMSKFGTIYPDDRHIQVTATVSTIVQFRHLDYYMEQCVLHIDRPHQTRDFNPAINITDSSVIDVWVLDTVPEFLGHVSESWKKAPSRRRLFTQLTIPAQSPPFNCPSNEFTTIELSCPPENTHCNVDFWQDMRTRPIGGFYMTQFQTGVDIDVHGHLPDLGGASVDGWES